MSTPAILNNENSTVQKGLSKSSKVRRPLHKDLMNEHVSTSTADIEDQVKEIKGWCVYLIISAEMRKTYVGVTTNFKRRLRQHNGELNGGAKASRAGRPWNCVCLVRGFKDRSEACGFEWKWKYFSRKSSRKLKQLDNLNEEKGYLSSSLIEHRQAALDKVKNSFDCQHLKVEWQGQISSPSM